jgi:low affinity Fe/Cu permease
MENKRSAGVTIFAWTFIIFNAIGLLIRFKYFSFATRFALLVATLCLFFYFVIGIFTAINLLKLKEWSRKLTIVLAILTVLLTGCSLFLANKAVERWRYNPKDIKLLENQYNNMPEDTKTRLNIKSKDEYINTVIQLKNSSVYIIQIIYGLIVLFFFTRPKVKEQFK